jgi:hypothetical protein
MRLKKTKLVDLEEKEGHKEADPGVDPEPQDMLDEIWEVQEVREPHDPAAKLWGLKKEILHEV